jgi:acyl-CoA synthetase (NDP forming)
LQSEIHRLFNPESIAVVGASNKPGKMGNLFFKRLAEGFRGKLHAVNPGENAVAGIATYRKIEAVPGPIDVLIALVPAPSLVALVEACQPGQVRFLLAVPSGFAEVAKDGPELQRNLIEAARRRGIRVLGPNVVGIMNGVLGLNASMMPELPPGGVGLSCLTQSGGFGMALSMYALDHEVAVAKFCDLGNTSDLEVHEVIDYLAQDVDTRVIGLFVESVRDQDLFWHTLKTAAAAKPVILTPVGVTPAGRRASHAHLGIAADALALHDRSLRGVIVTDTAQGLLDSAKAMMWQPGARSRRAAILTGTGGVGAELADLATRQGLDLPKLSPQLQTRLLEHLPYYAGVQNPIDCTPIWWDYAKVYPSVLKKLAESREVDLAIVSITDVAATLPDLAAALVAWQAGGKPLPIVVYWGARDRDRENMRILERAGIPCYRSTSEAIHGAAALASLSRP